MYVCTFKNLTKTCKDVWGGSRIFPLIHRVNSILDEWLTQEQYDMHDRLNERGFPHVDITTPPLGLYSVYPGGL